VFAATTQFHIGKGYEVCPNIFRTLIKTKKSLIPLSSNEN